MERHCEVSGAAFTVGEDDLRFYQRMTPIFGAREFPLPLPTISPAERLRRRLAWRNERHLYRGTCGLCKNSMLSIYRPQSELTVYCPDCWWSDRWDPLDFGRPYDPTQSFFEQLADLQRVVPRISLVQLNELENSEYTHDVLRLKDCYLVFDGEQSRSCCYGETFYKIQDCFDFLDLHESQFCYECIACHHCYNLKYSLNCFQCSESWFLRDCRGCSNCMFCSNLHQKEFHIYNEPYTKEQYEAFLEDFKQEHLAHPGTAWEQAKQFWKQSPVRYMRGTMNENVSGDYLYSCKDSKRCFNCKDLRDCNYCTNLVLGANDCHDIDVWGSGIELCFEGSCLGENVRQALGNIYVSHGAENIYYSQFCSRQVKNLFGCIGLRHKEYCVLNVQYSQDEYYQLAAEIAAHMSDAGEWGQFFPLELSPFDYHETLAQEYFPLEEVAHWRDTPDSPRTLSLDLPTEEILKQTLTCQLSSRPFRLQRLEVEYCKAQRLPLPSLHPDERHRLRFALRNPRELWDVACGTCGGNMTTSYAPDSIEQTVQCELCYQSTIN